MRGDIDGDDKIGLTESVNALQVVAGVRSSVAAKTINVPGDFTSIQEVIYAANSGDTVNISSGTYNESLTIAKDNIIIQGAGQDDTIISGNGTDSTILLNNSKNITIKNLQIRNGSRGIYLIYSSATISDSRIENNTRGLRAHHNSYLSMSNVSIKNNTDIGVRIRNGSSTYITNSEISSNGGAGLTGDRNASINIEYSNISSNGNVGIRAYLGSNLTIEECEISSNADIGIDVTAHSVGVLYGNNTPALQSDSQASDL